MSYAPVPYGDTMSESKDPGIELTPVATTPSLPRSVSAEHPHAAYYSDNNSPYLDPHKSSAIRLTRAREARESTPHGRARRIMRNIWLTAWLPVIAFAYLGFCYTAATRVVPVRVYKMNSPTDHLYGIKAGVTTISILIIGIALLPVRSLLDDLKGEEFFRRLRKAGPGMTLDHLNDVSTPSHTMSRGLISIVQLKASKFYAGALVSSIVAVMISSLAPAALSVGVIAVDNDVTAFRVGGVSPNSVFVSSLDGLSINNQFEDKASQAASMGWVQTTLGIDMTFKPTSPKYAVPVPLDIPTSGRARWLSDVLAMDPVCSWAVSDPPITAPEPNSTFIYLNLTLPTHGVRSSFSTYQLQSTYTKNIQVFSAQFDGTTGGLANITNGYPPTQGIMAWMISQCINCPEPTVTDKSMIDMSEIPTQKYLSTENLPAPNNTTRKELQVAILVCDPRATIETHEIRMDGSGGVVVQEDGRTYTPQGNLQLSQTRLLFARSLMAYPDSSGPDTGFDNIGQAGQVSFLFGPVPNATETKTLKLLPIENITHNYNLVEQAAMRSYLSGVLGVAYVPGRTQNMVLVFTSSLPHVIVSTVMFVFIALFVNVCYLRSDNEQFTLFSVSAALAHSNLPGVCQDVRYADSSRAGAVREAVALESLRGRKVRLANQGGPGHTLVLE